MIMESREVFDDFLLDVLLLLGADAQLLIDGVDLDEGGVLFPCPRRA